MDSEAWAAVYVTAGATNRLLAATATGCTNIYVSGNYSAADAILFVWDEGRNAQVTTPLVKGDNNNIKLFVIKFFFTNKLSYPVTIALFFVFLK